MLFVYFIHKQRYFVLFIFRVSCNKTNLHAYCPFNLNEQVVYLYFKNRASILHNNSCVVLNLLNILGEPVLWNSCE